MQIKKIFVLALKGIINYNYNLITILYVNIFFLLLLNLLGGHWLIKLYRFQRSSSMIHHLYIILYIHTLVQCLLPTKYPLKDNFVIVLFMFLIITIINISSI